MDEEAKQLYIKAGKIAANALKKAIDKIYIGMSLEEICNLVENEIINNGAVPAFPCNISINNIAAHNTADFEIIEYIPKNSVVKIDVGASCDGYLADTATTVCFNENFLRMDEFAKKALKYAIESIKPGKKTSEIGRIIFNELSKKELIGKDSANQREIDEILHKIDGTEDLSNFGAVNILSTSIANIKAYAYFLDEQIFKVINKKSKYTLPIPLGNMIGGGKHARGLSIDLQEILVACKNAENIYQAIEANTLLHKTPSGVDITISTYGGMLIYRKGEKPMFLERNDKAIFIIGSVGKRKPTGKLVENVLRLKSEFPSIINPIYISANSLPIKIAEFLKKNDLVNAGRLININHELLSALGVSTPRLDFFVNLARRKGAYGSKLTGAGGGGAFFALVDEEKVEKVKLSLAKRLKNISEVKIEEEGIK